MPYSPSDLRREIQDMIQADLAAGNIVRRGWVVSTILGRHPLPPMPDRDFNSCCRSGFVANEVRTVLQDWKKEDDDPEGVSSQPTLPGFARLRLAYPVLRDRELVIVPIWKMHARGSPRPFARIYRLSPQSRLRSDRLVGSRSGRREGRFEPPQPFRAHKRWLPRSAGRRRTDVSRSCVDRLVAA